MPLDLGRRLRWGSTTARQVTILCPTESGKVLSKRAVNAAPTSESDAAPLATRTKMPALEKLLPLLALRLLALRALAAAADTGASSSDPCFADATNTFHVSIDPYASELGSWKFLECGDTPMPVLAVEKGVTYTFEQFDA